MVVVNRNHLGKKITQLIFHLKLNGVISLTKPQASAQPGRKNKSLIVFYTIVKMDGKKKRILITFFSMCLLLHLVFFF